MAALYKRKNKHSINNSKLAEPESLKEVLIFFKEQNWLVHDAEDFYWYNETKD